MSGTDMKRRRYGSAAAAFPEPQPASSLTGRNAEVSHMERLEAAAAQSPQGRGGPTHTDVIKDKHAQAHKL